MLKKHNFSLDLNGLVCPNWRSESVDLSKSTKSYYFSVIRLKFIELVVNAASSINMFLSKALNYIENHFFKLQDLTTKDVFLSSYCFSFSCQSCLLKVNQNLFKR